MYAWHGQIISKAFDSLPHSWVIKSLELIGINNKILSFTKKPTSYWKKSMRLHTAGKLNRSRRYRNIRCNISRRLIITTAI